MFSKLKANFRKINFPKIKYFLNQWGDVHHFYRFITCLVFDLDPWFKVIDLYV